VLLLPCFGVLAVQNRPDSSGMAIGNECFCGSGVVAIGTDSGTRRYDGALNRSLLSIKIQAIIKVNPFYFVVSGLVYPNIVLVVVDLFVFDVIYV